MDMGAHEVSCLARAHWHHLRWRLGEMVGLDRSQVDSQAGVALLVALATIDAFLVRRKIEKAFGNTLPMHSHYHR